MATGATANGVRRKVGGNRESRWVREEKLRPLDRRVHRWFTSASLARRAIRPTPFASEEVVRPRTTQSEGLNREHPQTRELLP